MFAYRLTALPNGYKSAARDIDSDRTDPVRNVEQLGHCEPAAPDCVPLPVATAADEWELVIAVPRGTLGYRFVPRHSALWQAVSADNETHIQAGFYRDNDATSEDGSNSHKQASHNSNSSQTSALPVAQWRVCALLDVIGSPGSICLVDIPYLPHTRAADLAGIEQEAASPFQRLALTLVDALLHLEKAANLPEGRCPDVAGKSTSDSPGRANEATDSRNLCTNHHAASASDPTTAWEESLAKAVFTCESWPVANGQRAFALDSLAYSRQAYWHDPAISPDLQPWPGRGGICPNYRVAAMAPTSGEGERGTRYQVVSDCPGIGARVVPTQERDASHVLGNEKNTTAQECLQPNGEEALVAAEAPYARGLLAAFLHCLQGNENRELTTQVTGLEVGEIVLGEPDTEQLQALGYPVTRAWHVPTADGFVRVLESDPIWNDEGDTARWLRAAVFAPNFGYLGTLRWSGAEDVEFACANDHWVEWLLRGAAVGTGAALGGKRVDPAWLAPLLESVLDELRPQLPPAATRTQ